ncbi:MAG: TIGR03862 family flavoprotein [Pseudomonadota bacterium]
MQALVVGSGPAGLAAAEALARAGLAVSVAEAMPSPGRKFLMAGKSGLNLTMDMRADAFLAGFGGAAGRMAGPMAGWGPDAVCRWAEGLGQPVFTGSSGRVFPVAMKASPLLRAWLERLEGLGVSLNRRWRWIGAAREGDRLIHRFDTPEGPQETVPAVTVLALGGASWRRLGSDGAWTALLARHGVALTPFRPANMGFHVAWSAPMARHFGSAVKGVVLTAGGETRRGEFIVSARGIEGSGVYALYRPLREGAPLTIDLMPDRSLHAVADRLARPRGKATVTAHLRKSLGLDPVKRALVMELARPLPADPVEAARCLKALVLHHDGPRRMDEAISTAGGVAWEAVEDGLMLTALPGVFVAGEMLDWEAPTGGWLISGCLATGDHAGRAAADWARQQGQRVPGKA